jgi:hypothetical protein
LLEHAQTYLADENMLMLEPWHRACDLHCERV